MRIFFVAIILSCLAPSSDAQVACQPGLLVDTLPVAPLPGETVIVRIRNLGFNTYQIPNACVFKSVHPTNCGFAPIFTSTGCASGPFTLGPGSTFLAPWDQLDNGGQLVPPGKYSFKIPINGFPDCCLPVEIGACPTPPIYGVEGAGTGGFAPTLSASGPAQIGQPLQLSIQNGLGGAPSILFVTFAQTELAAPFGTLYVDLTPPFLQLVLPLSGAAGAPGQGSFTVNAALPNDPALATERLYLQALVLDNGSSGFLSHTAGLELYLCP